MGPASLVARHYARRQFLGLLTIVGGGALLAACSGGAATVGVVLSAPPSAAPGAATVVSGSAAPTAAVGPVRTAATPFISAGTDLGRMLATVHRDATFLTTDSPYELRQPLYFADLRTQLRNYGLAEITSYADLTATQLTRFRTVTNAVELPQEAGLESLDYAEDESLAVVGYNFWQVDRTLGRGVSDVEWMRLEGRFDRGQIARALVATGRATSQYGGETIYSIGADDSVNIADPVTQRLNLIGGFLRTVLEDAALTTHKKTRDAEAAIDVRAGRLPALTMNPDYDALALGLGPVVGAALLLPHEFYGMVNSRSTPVVRATPSPTVERLPPYNLVGVGLQDDGTTHTMVVALVYSDANDARIAAPIVRRRADNYRWLLSAIRRELLRDSAVAGEPRLVAAGPRTVLVLPLAIKDEANLGIWRKMLNVRDFGFIAEY